MMGSLKKMACAAILLSALAACGGRTTLVQPKGTTGPAIPAGATKPATATQLMTPTPQARPERNAELLRRSEERQEDPFDLPPKDD